MTLGIGKGVNAGELLIVKVGFLARGAVGVGFCKGSHTVGPFAHIGNGYLVPVMIDGRGHIAACGISVRRRFTVRIGNGGQLVSRIPIGGDTVGRIGHHGQQAGAVIA